MGMVKKTALEIEAMAAAAAGVVMDQSYDYKMVDFSRVNPDTNVEILGLYELINLMGLQIEQLRYELKTLERASRHGKK